MSITEVAQDYEIQTSADEDKNHNVSEETGDLTVPRINSNKRPMALVGEHYEHGDEDNVPTPPKNILDIFKISL